MSPRLWRDGAGIIQSFWALLGDACTPGIFGGEGIHRRAWVMFAPNAMSVEFPGVINWVPITYGGVRVFPSLGWTIIAETVGTARFPSKKSGLCGFIAGGRMHWELFWYCSDCLFLPKIQTHSEPRESLRENLPSSSSPHLLAVEEETWILPCLGSFLLDVYCSWQRQPNALSCTTRVTWKAFWVNTRMGKLTPDPREPFYSQTDRRYWCSTINWEVKCTQRPLIWNTWWV